MPRVLRRKDASGDPVSKAIPPLAAHVSPRCTLALSLAARTHRTALAPGSDRVLCGI